MTTVQNVLTELNTLGKFYQVRDPRWPDLLDRLTPWLSSYAELVMGEQHLEVITGSPGCETGKALANLALHLGATPGMVDLFLKAVEAFPGRMLGLKFQAGSHLGRPSLYVRTLIPRETGLAFLAETALAPFALTELRNCLDETHILYGLGFFATDDGPGIKTYTIGEIAPLATCIGWPEWLEELRPDLPDLGFVSHRIVRATLQTGVKVYWPDLAWDRIPAASPRWREVLSLGRKLGYDSVGHLGLHLGWGRTAAVKLYVERVGAIPTDFGAR